MVFKLRKTDMLPDAFDAAWPDGARLDDAEHGGARPEEARFEEPSRAASSNTIAAALLREGHLSSDLIVKALSDKRHRHEPLENILLSYKGHQRKQVIGALAQHWGLQPADLHEHAPDPRLIDRLGARYCLRHSVVPLRTLGGATLVAVTHPSAAARLKSPLTARLGPVVFALAPREEIAEALILARRSHLAQEAESRVPEAESCRNFAALRPRLWFGALALFIVVSLVLAPQLVLWVFTLWAITTLAFSNSLKIIAGLAASLTPRRTEAKLRESEPDILPTVSVIVALYKEGNIADRLVRRLGRIDYPAERLDIVLAIEEDDTTTRMALNAANLPSWMRILTVPEGQLKTKPRALNFALDGCRGDIIGVYDAEDAPDPGQIRKVAAHFAASAPDVVCLQGVLDFYNPKTNWLSRCFTVEYATWFRLILPGYQRLGVPIPLGGTTLFFRRKALENLGAWDAHNVTEDADLGIRLARHGYRTEMVDTVTEEEANCKPVAWVKQRSRWIKGYMMTWLVHMRAPMLLWRQLGTWRFIGFQIVFLCTCSQFLLGPLLWSFWLVPLGFSHPIADAMPDWLYYCSMALFILAEALNIAFGIIALSKTRHKMSRWWVPTLHLYWPLASFASYKALWETAIKPFYWDKTMHGEFDPAEEGIAPTPRRPCKTKPCEVRKRRASI